MTISRKIFNGRITIPGNQATSLNQLMKESALHWGYETTALTQPSMDSILGSEVKIIPDGEIWIGSDANVKNVASGAFYQGVHVAAAGVYSLQDQGPVGMIDPNQIWIYSVSGGGADVTFQAR